MAEWQPIETAPKDGTTIIAWYDHAADPYRSPTEPNKLTVYAAWADGGDYMAGTGLCVARWYPAEYESADEYGPGYYSPAWWFVPSDDAYPIPVNPTHWMPLPNPPPKK